MKFWVVLVRFQVNTQRRNWKIFRQCIETRSDSLKVLRYFFIDKGAWSEVLSVPLSLATFLALFCGKKFVSISFIDEVTLSWKLFSGISSKCILDSVGNSYCKMNYSKGAVNVVKNTHIKPQKIERIWLWQVFVWSVNLEKK